MLNNLRTQKNGYLWILSWVILWIVPWGEWFAYEGNLFLTVISDMLRLSVAVGLFIVPGALLFVILNPQENAYTGVFRKIPIGFTLSTLIIGILGLVGRLVGLSFEIVQNIFAFVGLVEMLVLMKTQPDFFRRKFDLLEKIRNSSPNIPLLAALFIGNLMLFNDSLFFIDDWTYLAYLTNWQQSTGLNFNEVIYGLNVTDAARFWFALYPMGQALLSELSGVPGILLLGHYLEFFLISIAILSTYFFARILGLSKRAAGFSAFAHTALLCWIVGGELNSVGMWFFQSMAEDKVTAVYIFAPVLFSFVIVYIQRPVFRNFLLLFLAGLSICFTHPIILFFSGCIVFGLTAISYLFRKLSWSGLVIVIFGIVIWMSPYIMIRLSDHPSIDSVPYNAIQAEDTFNIHRFITIRDNGLYGAPTHVLKFADIQIGSTQNSIYQIFRTIPLLIVFAAGLIGLRNIKKGFVYSYLFVSVILIVLAMNPYTGWLLGYFVSARLLNRVLWFAPLGIGLVVIVDTVLEFIKTGIVTRAHLSPYAKKIGKGIYSRIPLWGFVLLLVFGVGSPTMIEVMRSSPNLVSTLNYHKQLGQVGEFISNNNPEPVAVITLNASDDYLPGISAKAKPILVREWDGTKGHSFQYVFTLQELDERQSDIRIIRSLEAEIPLDSRRDLLDKYSIKYILADNEQVETYQEIMNQDLSLIEIVYQTTDFALFRVK